MDADPVFDRLVTDADRLRPRSADACGDDRARGAGSRRARSACSCSVQRDAGRPPGGLGGKFGLSEVGTVLVVVDLLFLAFVLVQFRYLFGGAELVRD